MRAIAEAENIELVRRMFDEWNARRPDGPELLDPDIVWDQRNHPVPEIQRVYHGREGVAQFWKEWLPSWGHISAEIHWIRAAGDRVVAWLTMRTVGRESGIELEFTYAWDVIVRDGRLARVAYIMDEDEALAAVGARP